MNVRRCSWPGCTKVVPAKLWGCKPHWYRLPKAIRDMLWATYRPGQEVTKYPSPAYVVAFVRASEWALKWEADHAPDTKQGSLF